MLARMHSACRTNEVYHAINCECRKEKDEALREIAQEGRGVFVYLEQEGRGTGITGKMQQLDAMFEWKDGEIVQRTDEQGERIDTDRAYKERGYPSEVRDFTCAAHILLSLGVHSVRLLTNNPLKIKALEDAGIVVVQNGIHIEPDNEVIASDLKSKAVNLGHIISPQQWSYHNGNGKE